MTPINRIKVLLTTDDNVRTYGISERTLVWTKSASFPRTCSRNLEERPYLPGQEHLTLASVKVMNRLLGLQGITQVLFIQHEVHVSLAKVFFWDDYDDLVQKIFQEEYFAGSEFENQSTRW